MSALPVSHDPPAASLPLSFRLAVGTLLLLPVLQFAAERSVTLPIGPSRMLTLGVMALALVPLARVILERTMGLRLTRVARVASLVLVPLLAVAHLMIGVRFGDGPFGPVPGGPFHGQTVAAPASWAPFESLRYAELEVDASNPRSLETVVLVHEGQLYVAANMPERKRWPRQVRENGFVRVRLDGKAVYALEAAWVDSPERTQALLAAMTAKYGLDLSMGGPIWFFALQPATG